MERGKDDSGQTALQLHKIQIQQLQAERERRREKTERLHEKLKALNNELAARKEELDRSKKELQDAQKLNKEEKEKATKEPEGNENQPESRDYGGDSVDREIQFEKVRQFMEEVLNEKTSKKVKRNELSIRIYDETELMVEKGSEEQEREALNVDSVLITYNVPNSDLSYKLSFRVDRNTVARKLREDACLFWGLSEVEYILKTRSDNAKVHDDLTMQNCFKKGQEEAHLALEQKNPKTTKPLLVEMRAIGPKHGSKSRNKKPENKETGDQQHKGGMKTADLDTSLRTMRGLYDFMIQRDQKVTDHVDRIKLRNMCIELLLCVLTLIAIFLVVPPTLGWNCRHGILTATTEPQGIAIPFLRIQTMDEVWEWLNDSLPNEVFRNDSSLRKSNYLPGLLEVRAQEVEIPDRGSCTRDNENSTCPAALYGKHTAGKKDQEIVSIYWRGCNYSNSTRTVCTATPPLAYPGVSGLAGRRKDSEPWKYTDSSRRNNLPGPRQTYDSSGYALVYDLQSPNLQDTFDAFQADMTFLREKASWLNHRTRALHVSYVAYNGNYNQWMSCWFLFEFPISGKVYPYLHIENYRPMNMAENSDFMVDVARLILVIYLSTINIYFDSRVNNKSTERERSSRSTCAAIWAYATSYRGMFDWAVALAFWFLFILRFVIFGPFFLRPETHRTSLFKEFDAGYNKATLYRWFSYVEPVLFLFCLARFLSGLQLNRNFFIIARTFGKAVAHVMRLVSVFLPVVSGFVFIAFASWGPKRNRYKDFQSSATFEMMRFAGHREEIYVFTYVLEFLYSAIFIFVMETMYLNAVIGYVVVLYQRTRVACGYVTKEYRWNQAKYAKWALCYPLHELLWNRFAGRQAKPEDDEKA
eukprot:TRINITY_DN25667_c0_g1_i1.p1 TRINITY_DN25667_c0_g1~~TRINITY_DN25667_c0_g1_i1.p1  ORF type:complete len:869 (+),score=112.63 TRINITY_DN25667_c0_g1_i1:172-2778(+)